MAVTTFDFGDVCLGTLEDGQTTRNAQGVVSFGERSMLQLADTAVGRLERLREVEPGYITFVGGDGLELTDRDYRAIAAIPGLRSVDFDNTSITNDQAALFCNEGMAGFNFGAPSIDDGVMDAVATVRSIAHLFLSGSSVTNAGIAKLAGHERIDALHLAQTRVTGECAPTLATLPKLETLHLDDVNDDVLIAAARPQTSWLHLRNGLVTEVGIEALVGCTSLEMLGLMRMELTNNALVSLAKLASVRGLFLGNSKFDDSALSRGLRGLTELDFVALNGTPAGDQSAAALGSLPVLGTVHLSETSVTDEGLRGLGASRSISYLSIDDTAASDEGIAYLREIASLETLSTENTAVTEAGRALLTQLPKPFELG